MNVFSKKMEYSFSSMILLTSYYYKKQVVSISLLAEELGIPTSFLAKIIQIFTKNKLLQGKSGVRGGVILAKNPSDIFLIDLYKLIDGNELMEKCLLGLDACQEEDHCPMHETWKQAKEQLVGFLENNTLEAVYADLKERNNKDITKLIKRSYKK